jgi:hypothetical protein
MVMRTKSVLATLASALVLAALVNVASANRLSLSSQTFRAVWAPIQLEGEGSELDARCNLTMEGTFHSRTFSKVARSLLGVITSAAFGPCEGGGAVVMRETLPWHLMYEGFTGTLPNITGVTFGLVGLGFLLFDIIFRVIQCQYRYIPTSPGGLIANVSVGTITGLRIDEARAHRLIKDDLSTFSCPQMLSYAGTAAFTVAGSATRLTIRLI